MTLHGNAHRPPARRGHERRDANPWAVLIATGGLAALVAVTLLIVSWTFDYFEAKQPVPETLPPALATATRPARLPSLDEDPAERKRMMEYRENEERRLSSCGRDPLTGMIHIPIDRAMELVLARGLPAREGVVTPTGTAPTNAAMPAGPAR